MSHSIRLLALVFVAQLVLAVALLWQHSGVGATDVGQPLLDFDAAAVDRIEISSAGHKLQINKVGEAWQLPDLDGFPADQARVAQLLARLQGLTASYPVATTDQAAQRFKVAEDDFVRRIRLEQGDKLLAELYLGEANGVRRVNGRVAGSSRVHALDFPLHQASDKAANWWERGYLHQDAAKLKAIQLGPVQLHKDGDDWTLADLAEGETLDKSAVDELVRRMTTLGFQEVVTDRSRLQGTVLLRLVFETAAGRLEYRFHSAGEKADPLLSIEGRPYGLRIPRFLFDALAKTTRDGLTKPAEVQASAD